MSRRKICADTGIVTFLPGLDFGASPCNGRDSVTPKESGPGVAHANRSAAPAQVKERQTSGTCGPCSETSFALADPELCSASKWPVPQLSERLGSVLQSRLSRFGSMEYGQTWKLRVTPSGLRYWAHTALGRRTSGSGCTGPLNRHPTPNLSDDNNSRVSDPQEYSKRRLGRPNACSQLADMEQALAGHPTPQHHDTQEQGRGRPLTASGRILCHNGKDASLNLPGMATLAGRPTPRAADCEQTGAHWGNPDTLPSCSKLAGHPTCTTRDHKDGTADSCANVPTNGLLGRECHGANTASTATSTAKTAGYRLNPGFSLWLMIGIPGIVAAWASCGARATQSCRRSRRSS